MARPVKPWTYRRFLDRAKLDDQGCLIWQGAIGGGGYGISSSRGVNIPAHKHIWETIHGPVPEGLVVRHKKCDNPPCINLAHLELGTHKQNTQDCLDAGRFSVGEKQHNSKLTETQIQEIREMRNGGLTLRGIGEHFGVTAQNVWYIVNGHSWKHVKESA